MIDMTITAQEFQKLIIESAPYTLGRRRYVVEETNELVRKYLPKIDNNTLGVLIRDIELETNFRDTLGVDFDKKMWLALLDALKNERDRRESEDD
jgi:hypothetical protein